MASKTEMAIQRLREGCSLDEVLEDTDLPGLGKFLMSFVYKKDISIDTLADLAALNRSTIYRICDDKVRPSSNILIRLSRILEMNIDDTQRLLKCGNLATLSGERPRDLVIMDGIIKNKGIADINDDLVAKGYPDLFTKR